MSKHTLLFEIAHAESDKPLRLMCGHGFNVLRKDITGDEIYGVVHEGKEYLLFPLAFRKHEDGILSVEIPATGEEPFLSDRDGHTITFKSPQGIPFFSEMSEAYRSCTGMLRLDADKNAFVHLDKVTAD